VIISFVKKKKKDEKKELALQPKGLFTFVFQKRVIRRRFCFVLLFFLFAVSLLLAFDTQILHRVER
jgi:hypothetical protein